MHLQISALSGAFIKKQEIGICSHFRKRPFPSILFNPLGQKSNGLIASLCPLCTMICALAAVSSQISETVEGPYFKVCIDVS